MTLVKDSRLKKTYLGIIAVAEPLAFKYIFDHLHSNRITADKSNCLSYLSDEDR